MSNPAIRETPKGARVGRMFVGADRGRRTRWNDPADQFLNALSGGLGIGPSVALLKVRSFPPLRGSHGATSAKLCLVESVHVMGDPDEQVEIKGPVLAVLEGPEAIEDQRFLGRATGSHLLLKEKTMPPQAFGLALHGAVGDAELATDLAQAGAADQAMEEGLEEPCVFQPVARREGL
jgi:hypothetical protein